VQDLSIEYYTTQFVVKAVNGISFDMNEGETLGLAGESGCGKTTCALALLKLLPENSAITGGQVLLGGTDVLGMNEEELRSVRWNDISIVFQGAMNALNPVKNIGNQIVEPILLHKGGTEEEAIEKAGELLELVGIHPRVLKNYPHELSGGMRQRVMIAMALCCDPRLMIADEPVTALDVMIQAQILELIKDLKKKLDLSMILITHDLAVIAEEADRVAIMYAGELVEFADSATIYSKPVHPYTQKLILSFPKLGGFGTFDSIRGSPPSLATPPPGCRFHPRCDQAMDICEKVKPLMKEEKKGHYAACHLLQ
jgi:peptide/nickel transport system ATP-binding protein